MQAPETRYAKRRDGVNIAYQTFGEGPPLVVCLGFVSHLDLQWTEPDMARFFNRLGSFSRVIVFEARTFPSG